MSQSLINARNFLMENNGEYGRIKFEWLRQKYNVGIGDEMPEAMRIEIYGKEGKQWKTTK